MASNQSTTAEELKARAAAYMKKWREANKQHRADYAKAYWIKNESYREAKRQSDREYYHGVTKNNPEALRKRSEYGRQWVAQNPDKVKAKYSRFRIKNRDKRVAYSRQYYECNREAIAEYRKSNAERYRKWREEHREESRQWSRDHWAKNRERLLSDAKKYYEQNKTAFIIRANKRRTLLVGDYTPQDIENLYDSQCGVCAGCLKELNGNYEIDHIMPLALDPAGDRLDNLQILCMPCNRKKHAKHPDEWALMVERIRQSKA
jgi:5-methylcytosine-specific restriction endonuclease McrA